MSALVTGLAGTPPRQAAVLLLVIGLHLVAETALTPFLPQLFRTLYGIDDLAATGTYVWVCRVVGFLALPLWGLAARRWPLPRLVFTGLCASAVLDAALGFAPSYAAFTALSAAVVATNTALLLAYPALVAGYEGGDRLPGVRAYVAVFHAATVVSTLAGAAVMALPDPRFGISAFAVADAALAVLCLRVLGVPHRPAAGDAVARRAVRARDVAAVAALAVFFEIAANVIRPFFVEYAASGGFGTTAAALLFLLPAVAALAVMPLAEQARRALGGAFLPVAFTLAAVGLAWQALAPEELPLIGGRILFGVGLGLSQVALDLRMFEATGTAGPAYTVVETARTGALFVTPVLAAAMAAHELALPLGVAAGLYLAAAALAPRLAPASEENVVP
ncbi:hypothetical protein TH66_14755 [Carbonactinospora thermoautotrophica]|uniref:Vibrioferrin membrane-spanning transport protein PvsC n=2 Tax=Carbonactinospora thermoautotrophica TaxID=1469144 RepID=A0A132MVG6_9ACTN|nr:hypothetical protein [Carbonactinospora thermoautotrophica]KWX00166.1 hypothetical protein TH66_14755 [Carbonactinospora thermoautotrophica]KWX01849.1 Vibrioferrin membrane-spanning transport protein PvsC [Carbonactinospora thermoautotrophica]